MSRRGPRTDLGNIKYIAPRLDIMGEDVSPTDSTALIPFEPPGPFEAKSEEEFEDALSNLASQLLFDTTWSGNENVPLLSDIPMICKGNGCPFASLCPIIAALKKENPKDPLPDDSHLIGTRCRAERAMGIEKFAELVMELNITPDAAIDVINVANLVRHLIMRRRVDWHLTLEGILIKEPRLINQKSGLVHWATTVHPLMKEVERLDKMIGSLQKQLMADRQAKAALMGAMGRPAGQLLADLFGGKHPDVIEADIVGESINENDETY